MTQRIGDWMQTSSGLAFWPCDPDPAEVCMEDIAASLARLCRFGGHVTCPHYSVAEHSVRASLIVPKPLALQALLHDAAEAYIVDVPRPVKAKLGAVYKELEEECARAIGVAYGVELVKLHPDVRLADEIMLATEKRDVMAKPPRPWHPLPDPLPERIEPWSSLEAERRFIERWLELGGWG